MASELFNYNPSLPAAIAFAAVFIILTLIQSFLVLHVGAIQKLTIDRERRKRFCCMMIPFIIGLFLEFVGYGARAIATKNQDSIPIYAIQALFILIAPVLLAATLYMVFGELVRTTNTEQFYPIPLRKSTKIFVGGDIISFLIQAAGGASSASEDTGDKGGVIVTVGLFVQIVFFCGFLVVSILYSIQVYRSSGKQISKYSHWKLCLAVIFFTSFTILVRSVFRVVEDFSGEDGPIASKEILIYGLDAAPILIGSIIFVLFNFSRIFSKYQTLNEESGYLLLSKDADGGPFGAGSVRDSYSKASNL